MKKIFAIAIGALAATSALAQNGAGWWMPNFPQIPIQTTPEEVCVAFYAGTYGTNTGLYPYNYYDTVQENQPYPSFSCRYTNTSPYLYYGPHKGSEVRNASAGCEKYGCRSE